MFEKIDALDLVISCLKDHEKDFDNLVDRLEKAVSMIERICMK